MNFMISLILNYLFIDSCVSIVMKKPFVITITILKWIGSCVIILKAALIDQIIEYANDILEDTRIMKTYDKLKKEPEEKQPYYPCGQDIHAKDGKGINYI